MFTSPFFNDSIWQAPPARLTLANNEVHIWQARRDLPASQLALLRRTLSADELARMQRLQLAEEQRRFVASRGILRALLGRYIGVAPAEIAFQYTAQGKPELDLPAASSPWRFNVAHSGDQALYAISWGRVLGVDVEELREAFDYSQITRSLFAPEERAALWSTPLEQRADVFFRYWVCKEAYMKARGLGFELGLDQFAMILEADQSARLLYAPSADTRAWIFRQIPLGHRYRAALAIEQPGQALRYQHYRWSV